MVFRLKRYQERCFAEKLGGPFGRRLHAGERSEREVLK